MVKFMLGLLLGLSVSAGAVKMVTEYDVFKHWCEMAFNAGQIAGVCAVHQSDKCDGRAKNFDEWWLDCINREGKRK